MRNVYTLPSNLFPSHACVASIKGSVTPNLLFVVGKNGGGVEVVSEKNEIQDHFLCVKPWSFLRKDLSLQSKLSKIGI